MISELHLATLAGYVALMAGAAIVDFRLLIIPNPVVIGLMLLWPAYLVTVPAVPPYAAIMALGGALAVFAVGALLFARGLIGGGDVKLLSVATLWSGIDRIPALLLATGVLGGVLSLFLLTPLGARITAARRTERRPVGAAEIGFGARPVPYGAAIAAAAVLVILPMKWG